MSKICLECKLPLAVRSGKGRPAKYHPACARVVQGRQLVALAERRKRAERPTVTCSECPNRFRQRHSRHFACSDACGKKRLDRAIARQAIRRLAEKLQKAAEKAETIKAPSQEPFLATMNKVLIIPEDPALVAGLLEEARKLYDPPRPSESR